MEEDVEPDTGSRPDLSAPEGVRPVRYAGDRGGWPRLARPEGCFATSLSRSAALGRRASLGTHGQERTVTLIHYAIGDSEHRLSESGRITVARAPLGRGTNRVLGPRAEPWQSDISERRCADIGVAMWDPDCRSRVRL